LEQNVKAGSDAIKAKKALINESQSYANVVGSERYFVLPILAILSTPRFFDIEDDHFAKVDLWLAASMAVDLTELFYGVNAGRT
jgi:hypothetical protein